MGIHLDQPSANPEQVTLRGGSWSDNLVHARSANKHYLPTDVPCWRVSVCHSRTLGSNGDRRITLNSAAALDAGDMLHLLRCFRRRIIICVLLNALQLQHICRIEHTSDDWQKKEYYPSQMVSNLIT